MSFFRSVYKPAGPADSRATLEAMSEWDGEGQRREVLIEVRDRSQRLANDRTSGRLARGWKPVPTGVHPRWGSPLRRQLRRVDDAGP